MGAWLLQWWWLGGVLAVVGLVFLQWWWLGDVPTMVVFRWGSCSCDRGWVKHFTLAFSLSLRLFWLSGARGWDRWAWRDRAASSCSRHCPRWLAHSPLPLTALPSLSTSTISPRSSTSSTSALPNTKAFSDLGGLRREARSEEREKKS